MRKFAITFEKNFTIIVEAENLKDAHDAANNSILEIDSSWDSGEWHFVIGETLTKKTDHGIKDGKIVHIDDV
jgi:hypothetical protein